MMSWHITRHLLTLLTVEGNVSSSVIVALLTLNLHPHHDLFQSRPSQAGQHPQEDGIIVCG